MSKADPREVGLGLLDECASLEEPPTGGLGVDQDVVGDRHRPDHRQFLMHDGDAQTGGLRGVPRGWTCSPSSRMVPGVGGFEAGQDLRQGGLTAAVLADEGVNLAGLQGQ